jgi:hypothetical protein
MPSHLHTVAESIYRHEVIEGKRPIRGYLHQSVIDKIVEEESSHLLFKDDACILPEGAKIIVMGVPFKSHISAMFWMSPRHIALSCEPWPAGERLSCLELSE